MNGDGVPFVGSIHGGVVVRLDRATVVAVCAAILVAACGGGIAKPSAATPIPTDSNPMPIRAALEIVARIPVQKPLGLAVLDDRVWATTPSGAALIDPSTNAVTATVKLGSGSDEIDAITADGTAVWVSDFDTSAVYRIDPKTLRVVAEIPVGLNPAEIFATADAVWVANHRDGTVSRIDPSSNRVVATIKIGPEGPSGPQWIAVGLGSVWVSVPNIASVVRIDAVTNSIQATIPGPFGAIALSPGAAWVTEAPTVARIDPGTNQVVATVDIGGSAADPAVIDEAPWFAVNEHADLPGTLVRVDPGTNRVDRVLTLIDLDGSTPIQLTDATLARVPAGSSLWIGDASEPGRVLRFPLAQLSGL